MKIFYSKMKCVKCFSEAKGEDQIMEEIQVNSSLQTKEIKVLQKWWKNKLSKFLNYCISKGKSGGFIIWMFYVSHFFCEWQCKNDIWCMCYMLCYSNHVLFFNRIMKLKEGKIFYYKTRWNNTFEKTYWSRQFQKFEFFLKKYVLKWEEI